MANSVTVYCPTCSKQVPLVKKTNWSVIIGCAVLGGVILGTIAYSAYAAFIKKADTFTCCKKKSAAHGPSAGPSDYARALLSKLRSTKRIRR